MATRLKNRFDIRNSSNTEYNEILESIHKMFDSGVELNPYELELFCETLPKIGRSKISICEDYCFKELYFRSVNGKSNPDYPKLNNLEKERLDKLADEFELILSSEKSDRLLIALRQELKGATNPR